MPTPNGLAAMIFWLILAGLVLRYWRGANSLLDTGLGKTNTIIKTLEQ